MPFSSVLGASSAIKPGVVTSSTRPTVPYVGQMIFETDTNKLGVWNGSEWRFFIDVDTPPALELVKTQTIGTAVSTVTVTDAFSSTYDNYLITVGSGVASTEIDLGLRLGSTTTGYYGSALRVNWAASSSTASDNNNSFFEDLGRGTTTSLSFNCTVFAPYLAKNTIVHSSWVGTIPASLGGTYNGFLNDTTSYTAFTLIASTGTLTGGTIRVYGYRNS
jgi:hypothetical protein